jgi:hypothetical protein
MAVYEYLYDCPQCDQSESVCVIVRFHQGDASAQKPIWECGCALTREEKADLMDQALEEAEEDMWDLLENADADARADRWVDQQSDEWYSE